MTDEQYGEDSQKMMVFILLLEAKIKAIETGVVFNEEEWLSSLDHFNFGRELLDRKFVKMFFGGGPKGVNSRIRKALIALMLHVDQKYPQAKGPNFDEALKEQMRKIA